jgi:hypothetical protein
MAKGCRDCSRCTEAAAVGLAKSPFRIVKWAMWDLWVGLFRKKCPQCGHYLGLHKRIDGKFAD